MVRAVADRLHRLMGDLRTCEDELKSLADLIESEGGN